jgi:hypothetical protein
LTPSDVTPSRFIQKLEHVMALSADEHAMLIGLEVEVQQIKSQTDIIFQDTSYQSFYILREGWAIRYKLLNDGKRQILNFLLPGDCVGLSSVVFQQADHAVTTVTPASVSLVDPSRLMELFRRHPWVGAALYWELSQEPDTPGRCFGFDPRTCQPHFATSASGWAHRTQRPADSDSRFAASGKSGPFRSCLPALNRYAYMAQKTAES